MIQPLTKYTKQLVNGDNIPSHVREAFRLAKEERPGAVQLELREEIADEETKESLIRPRPTHLPVTEQKAVRAAVARTERAKRLLLLAGPDANRKLTSRMLRQLVDNTGILFVTTQMSKGVPGEGNPLFLGNATLSAGDFVHRAFEAADLIINVGHDVMEKLPFFNAVRRRESHPHQLFLAAVDPVYFPQFALVGDITNSIRHVTERVLAPAR